MTYGMTAPVVAVLLTLIAASLPSCATANYLSSSRKAWFPSTADVKPFYGCETSSYPPNPSASVPHYTIDLSLQPQERWTALVTDKRQELLALIGHVHNLTEALLGETTFQYLLTNLGQLSATLPSPYRQEMEGIAAASGLDLAEVTLYNIFYELFTFCTSIVAQDSQGHVYHGRNLDFGLFMGWNRSFHQWTVTELLRPLVVELDWRGGNGTLFSSINYVGYVGIITGVKKGAFSFSLDERFSWNGGFVGILEWIMFGDHQQRWLSFLTREVMLTATTYEEAQQQLTAPRLLAPAYFILAGTKAGQGCIITRYRDDYNLLPLGSRGYLSSWYLVQTNYDHWTDPPPYDDRRTPAVTCLDRGSGGGSRGYSAVQQDKNASVDSDHRNPLRKFSSDVSSSIEMFKNIINFLFEKTRVKSNSNNTGIRRKGPRGSHNASSVPPSNANDTLALLYNVLSTRPVLNKLTSYTTLMSATLGHVSTTLRDCPDPCWPW